ncbi:unnamed protein product [Gadus morhua 'NCC']
MPHFAYHSSTTVMLNHLARKHPKPSSQQGSIANFTALLFSEWLPRAEGQMASPTAAGRSISGPPCGQSVLCSVIL